MVANKKTTELPGGFYMLLQYVALSVVIGDERATCPRTFVLFSCSCCVRRAASDSVQHLVAGRQAPRHGGEDAGVDLCRVLALVLPLHLAEVGVDDLLGDDDADAAAGGADDVDLGALEYDGVALAGADVADAEAGGHVAARQDLVAGLAVAGAVERTAGGGHQREYADQTGGGDATASGTTKTDHGFLLVVDEHSYAKYTRASDHIVLHSWCNFNYIL